MSLALITNRLPQKVTIGLVPTLGQPVQSYEMYPGDTITRDTALIPSYTTQLARRGYIGITILSA